MNKLFVALVILGLLTLWAPQNTVAQEKSQKPDDGDLAPDGLKALKHANPQVRFNAVELLGKLGKNAKFAVPHLKELLKDPSVAVRIKVVESLWKIEQTDPKLLLPVLQEAMGHDEDIVRATSLSILAQLGEKAKPAVPAVKKALKDKAFNVRLQAVLAAGAIGPLAKDTVPEMIEIMRDDDTGFLEAQATITLSKIGAGAVPPLVKALGDKSPKVRRASAFALGLLGPKAYEAVPDLTKALKDNEPLVRSLAAEALGKIGSEAESALPELNKALKDADAGVRINAALALWRIGQNTAGVNELADILSKQEDASTRRAAAMALAHFGPAAKTALTPLASALKDKDAEVRQEVTFALGKIGADVAKVAVAIHPLLEDKSVGVRLHAVLALWRIEKKITDKGLNVLKKGLEQDETDDVLLALRVFGEVGPAAKAAVPALMVMLKHSDKSVRDAAAQALQQVAPQAGAKKGTR